MIAFARDPLDAGHREFLDVHQEGAVAVDVDHLLVGERHLRAERGRVAEAHRAEAGAGDERARMIEVIVLRRPTSGAGRRPW